MKGTTAAQGCWLALLVLLLPFLAAAQTRPALPVAEPVERHDREVVIKGPVRQPVVMQSLLNNSVSSVVLDIPFFHSVAGAWDYINRATPLLLSGRNFTLRSVARPPTVLDMSFLAEKTVMVNTTFSFENMVVMQGRKMDAFGLDWVFDSDGSTVAFTDVTFLDPLCLTTPEQTLQATAALPRLPGFPPNRVSVLPASVCLQQPWPEAATWLGDSLPPACFDRAVHFADLALLHVSDPDPATRERKRGYTIQLHNVTRLCGAYIDKGCLQDKGNASLCWELQAARLQQGPVSNGSASRLSTGAIAGIVVGCIVALLAAVLAACLCCRHRRCRQQQTLGEQQQHKALQLAGSGASPEDVSSSGSGSAVLGKLGRKEQQPQQSRSSYDLQEVVTCSIPGSGSHTSFSTSLPSPFPSQQGQKQHNIQLGLLLGAGSFGRVYKGRWQGADVAIKVIHCRPQELNSVLREAEVMTALEHDNVLRCMHCCVLDPQQAAAAAAAAAVEAGGDGSAAGVRDQRQQQHGQAAGAVPSSSSVSSSTLGPGSSAAGSSAAARRLGTGGHQPHHVVMQQQQEGSCESSYNSNEEAEGRMRGRQELQVWLVLELCTGGSLHDYSSKPRTRFDMARLVCRLLEVASGMAYLHSKGIVHGDLKSANVLLKNTIHGSYGQTCKVSDFGLASMLLEGATHRSTERLGTITHQAPEVLERGHLSPSGDVFSFGIMMWELFCGSLAFKGLHYGAVVQRVVVAGERPPLPLEAPHEYNLLMTHCWAAKPHDRPTFAQISQCLGIMLQNQDCGTLDLQPPPPSLSELFPSQPRPELLFDSGQVLDLPSSADAELPTAGTGTVATGGTWGGMQLAAAGQQQQQQQQQRQFACQPAAADALLQAEPEGAAAAGSTAVGAAPAASASAASASVAGSAGSAAAVSMQQQGSFSTAPVSTAAAGRASFEAGSRTSLQSQQQQQQQQQQQRQQLRPASRSRHIQDL